MPHNPGIQTGENTPPRETIAQGTIEPGTGPLSGDGPQDWDDLILHTGEARGMADTALHSLEPDAPTVGAARVGHRFQSEGQNEIPDSDNQAN